MKKQEILSAMKAGRLTRRDMMKLMSATGVTMALIPMGRARAADEAINFTWEGYNEPGFHPAYAEKHGAEPEGPYFADVGEALAKVRSGFKVDVVHPCNLDLKNWRDADVMQPIDTGRLSHFGDLFESLTKLEFAQGDNGEQYFIPVDWGNTSILYRPDLVEVQEESWTMLWDERYSGQISMAADATESAAIAGIVLGVADPFNMTDEELAKAKDLLVKQKSLLRFYWDSNSTVEQALASGELVMSTGWNSSVVTLQGQGVPVKFANPKEGIMSYCCGLVLMKDAPHIDKAYDLIDAMIAPEAGKWLIESYGYGHSNKKTFEIVEDAMLNERGLPKDPNLFFAKGIFQRPTADADRLHKMFEEVKAGA
ncbi:spermidine/putrescine transport system substrate-binding protein [Dongia mobilis]|uniref:Spermidine/putrescine transport system substrate-binding protein n=1 Tax=Dongia mobilis TaxID=578943 RepID=A0A4R6WKR6_9PROT|nr:extracellular solute-binding protein [Dongia mobilis]TDQ78831.1 spermidine/putrescine transport system substrate-binding protein [Dongia mobilis]